MYGTNGVDYRLKSCILVVVNGMASSFGVQRRQKTRSWIRIFDKLKGEIAEGTWVERLLGEDYTFENLMEKYMTEYSAVNKAPESHKRDKSLNAHRLKCFGKFYLPDIKPKMISEYKIKRRNEGASPRTINYELTLMSHAFNLATKEQKNDQTDTFPLNNAAIMVLKEKWNDHQEEVEYVFPS
jgi:hypothetical protein